jgi:hypothetical protein
MAIVYPGGVAYKNGSSVHDVVSRRMGHDRPGTAAAKRL